MERAITVVLPVENRADEPAPRASPLATLAGARVGVVDNGLWRSMPTIVAALEADLTARGAASFETLPFDHLAPDFGDRLAELAPFAERIDAAVTGLGH